MKQLNDFLLLHGYGCGKANFFDIPKNSYTYSNTFGQRYIQIMFIYNSITNKYKCLPLSGAGFTGSSIIKNKIKVITWGLQGFKEYLVEPNQCIDFLLKNKFVQMDIIRDIKLNSII